MGKGKREEGHWETREEFRNLRTSLMNLIRPVYYLSKRAGVPKGIESFL